jgi:5-methylcytosine-specific restriction endonuclease McrA
MSSPRVSRRLPCRRCGELSDAALCVRHRSTEARGYGTSWRMVRDAAVTAHVARYGWVCPGWQRPAHTVTPGQLTGDHRVPMRTGGTAQPGNVAILCHSCNSRKGGREGGGEGAGRAAPAGAATVPVRNYGVRDSAEKVAKEKGRSILVR